MRDHRLRMASVAAACLLCAPVFAICAAAQARQPVVLEVSEELLQDGIDAIKDRRPDLARQIFKSLLASHPQSVAARKASAELAKLDQGTEIDDAPSKGRAADGFDENPRDELSEHIQKLRYRLVSEVGDRVFFAESSAVIGGRARAILEAQARWLKRSPSLAVTIIGRADDGGSRADATALARQRAEVVRAKLIEGGISGDRIKIETRGNGDPVATCGSALCQAQNRHAETVLRLVGRTAGNGHSGAAVQEPAVHETFGAEAAGAGRGSNPSLAR